MSYKTHEERYEYIELYKELEFIVEETELKVEDALLLMQIREQRALNRRLIQLDDTLRKTAKKNIGSINSISNMLDTLPYPSKIDMSDL